MGRRWLLGRCIRGFSRRGRFDMSVLGLKASIATFYAMSFGLYNIGNIRDTSNIHVPDVYVF